MRWIFLAAALFSTSAHAQLLVSGVGDGGFGPAPGGAVSCASGNPVQVQGQVNNIASGSATGSSTLDVPVGSTVVVGLNVATVPNQSISSIFDGHGTPYIIVQPPVNAGTTNNAFAYAINTPNDIPIGTTWNVATSGSVIWNLKGVWVTCTTGPLDQAAVTVANPSNATSATLTSSTLNSSAVTAFGFLYCNLGLGGPNGCGTITTGPGFISLLNNTFNDVAYKVQSGSTTAVTYAPSW